MKIPSPAMWFEVSCPVCDEALRIPVNLKRIDAEVEVSVDPEPVFLHAESHGLSGGES